MSADVGVSKAGNDDSVTSRRRDWFDLTQGVIWRLVPPVLVPVGGY